MGFNLELLGAFFGFFNSKIIDGKGDREYSAAHFAHYFAKFIGNGIYAMPTTNPLQILTGTTIGLPEFVDGNYTLYAVPGSAFINGYLYESGINPVPITYNRVLEPRNANVTDRIVLRWDDTERRIYITISAGSPSSMPTPPDINNYRNEIVYDLGLAEITLGINDTQVTQFMIRDTRPIDYLCGWVSWKFERSDITDPYIRFEAELLRLVNNLAEGNQYFQIINEDTIARDLATKVSEDVAEAREQIKWLEINQNSILQGGF